MTPTYIACQSLHTSHKVLAKDYSRPVPKKHKIVDALKCSSLHVCVAGSFLAGAWQAPLTQCWEGHPVFIWIWPRQGCLWLINWRIAGEHDEHPLVLHLAQVSAWVYQVQIQEASIIVIFGGGSHTHSHTFKHAIGCAQALKCQLAASKYAVHERGFLAAYQLL